jgi:hypothetical protein
LDQVEVALQLHFLSALLSVLRHSLEGMNGICLN